MCPSMLRPSDTTDSDQSSISGIIERVTFHSEDSGFAVLRVKVAKHRDLVTVVGTRSEDRLDCVWLYA